MSPTRTQQLLDHLCVKLGFCLPSDAVRALCEAPPDSAAGFTDAVFVAEGLDPATAERALYRQVLDAVSEAYRAEAERELHPSELLALRERERRRR